MKDFKFLKFLDRFKSIFKKLGVDYEVMRKILQIKLLMDGRRVPTVFAANDNKKSEKDNSNRFLKSLWVYILIGLMLIPFILMESSYLYQMSIVFGIIMFLIMSSLISDFSSVLLDVRDKNIIGTKPVDSRTLNFAKTIHVSLYMFYVTIALILPALIASVSKHGILFTLMFIVAVIFLDMFIIVLTSFLYLIILRFFDGEKLKDVINYFQIILSLVIAIGYQMVGRLFQVAEMNVQFTPKWWQYLLPPVWFAAPFEIMKKSEINLVYGILSVMAVVVPITAIAFYVKSMAMFEENLQKMTNNSGKRKKVKRKPGELISKILCRSKEERLFFRFTSDMIKNEREFKLKVYPSLGLAIIFPFIFIFQRLSMSSFAEISKGKSYFFIYFTGMMLSSIIIMVKYSGNYKGAWIYKTMPINNYKPVFKGTMKALIAKLFLPIFLFQAAVFIAIFGVRITGDLVVILLNMMSYTLLCFMTMKKGLPFSQPYDAAKQSDVGINFILMFVIGAIWVAHYFIGKMDYSFYILLGVSIVANLILWNVAFNIKPEKLDKALGQ
ncbi:hypothetical protein J2Z44_002771 [Clostridium punense]|uniref:ABC transporter permease n=1 Tax=Clostridium punense TaxID=1054297 RepID=A0ABS4K589_9CLOT|nr:hypothetical protein [Clostridium punense]MBP2022946.1 hypothetical protein [Clostridium punense]